MAQAIPVKVVAPLPRQDGGWATINYITTAAYNAYVIDQSRHVREMPSALPTVLYSSNNDITNVLDG